VGRLDPIATRAYTAGVMLAERLESRDEESGVDNFVHIDLVQLLSFLDELPTSKAMRAYRKALRAQEPRKERGP
jgi:hypothetical protein